MELIAVSGGFGSIGGIIVFLIVGLIAGALARLIMPGQQNMSILMTMVLGCVGSLVAGLVVSLITGQGFGLNPMGIIASVIGALVVLGIYLAVQRRA